MLCMLQIAAQALTAFQIYIYNTCPDPDNDPKDHSGSMYMHNQTLLYVAGRSQIL